MRIHNTAIAECINDPIQLVAPSYHKSDLLMTIQSLLQRLSGNKLSVSSVVTVQLPPTRVGTATSLKIWMYARLLCGYPARRIVHQHGIEQVKAVMI